MSGACSMCGEPIEHCVGEIRILEEFLGSGCELLEQKGLKRV